VIGAGSLFSPLTASKVGPICSWAQLSLLSAWAVAQRILLVLVLVPRPKMGLTSTKTACEFGLEGNQMNLSNDLRQVVQGLA
jgi:hypothetical protein